MKGLPGALLPRLSIILLLAALPAILILFGYVWQSHNQVIQERNQYAVSLVEVLAQTQDDFIARTRRYLERLAKTPQVQHFDEPACGPFLRQIGSVNGDYLNLAIAQPDGELVCSLKPLSGRVNVTDRDFFQRALVNKGFTIGAFQIDRVSKLESIGFAYPIIDPTRARVSGVAIAVVSLKAWSQRLGEMSLPAGANVFLADRNHTIIAHYPLKRRVIGLFSETYGYNTQQVSADSGTVALHTQDAFGEARLQAYKSLKTIGEEIAPIVGICLPLKGAIEAAREQFWDGLMLICLGLLVLFGVTLFWLKRIVVQPLTELLDYSKTQNLDKAKQMPLVSGASEVRELQTLIVAMLDTRHSTDSNLYTSEARFRQITEAIQEVFWVVTPDWKQVLYVSPAYENIWQRSVESLYAAPGSWLSSVISEDRQQLLDYIAELRGGDCSNIVFPMFRIERRDGTIRWISVKGFPTYDDEGDLSSVTGIAEDVTVRKQYEIELSERESKYRMLVEHAEDLVVKFDTDGHLLFVSPSYCRTFGKSEHQLLGKAFMPLLHEEDQAATNEAMKGLYYPPFRVYLEQRTMTMQGWRWFGWSDSSILDEQQQVIEIIGVGRDITQQKQAEFALRESETRYRELVDNMSDGVAVYQRIGETENFLITNLNHAAERMAGYTKEEVIGQQVDHIFPGVREMGLLDSIRQVATEGNPQRRPVCSYRDQRIELWLEYYIYKLPSGEVVAVFRDVTAEQHAIDALKRSEEKFRSLFEDLSIGLVIADQNGVTQETNKSFAQMFGVDREQMIGRSLQELLAVESPAETADRLADLVNGRLEDYSFQASYNLADERKLTANIAICALYDDKQQRAFLYGIAEDVTVVELARAERDRLQRERMRTYRLEALGRLAGGIAHDFNNILGAISGFIELALMRLGRVEPKQIIGYLEQSQKSSARAIELVKQLRDFSRAPENRASTPQDFGQLITNSMEIIRSLLPSSISFDIHLAEQPFRVACDPGQVEQVLLNLCISARDAMDGQGKILVSLDSYHAEGERCVICSERVKGAWVSLLVQDSGKGITHADMERIFEPFYTIEGREKSGGLELSIVHAIVAGYNGHILVESDPEVGTSFRILFPPYVDEVEALGATETEQASSESALLAPGSRVLLVDDEASLRQLLKEALVGDGYEVEVCTDGSRAWELLRNRAHNFDLLITDQTMPHITGLDLVRMLRAEGDTLPVVLCTGFSEKVNPRVMKELNISHYLEKPIALDAFKALLHTLSSGAVVQT